jgi:DNA-binding transcriptional ArsR family regulator
MTAGELADQFPLSRPTMSAHFAVLREADLIESTKIGTTITYQLKLSVLEDALLGFARLFGVGDPAVLPEKIPAEPQKGPAE